MYRQTIYDIACNKDLPGCSGCSEVSFDHLCIYPFSNRHIFPAHFNITSALTLLQSPRQCPEWSTEDVTTLMSLDFRLTGMVSALSILYLAGALIVGGLVDNSLAHYKSDFV